ncbi:MAG: T9SS type A sorting domain-containing protein [bacterium]
MKNLVIGLILLFVAETLSATTIVFDDAHKPTNSVHETNPVCEFTAGLRGGYRDLALFIGQEGYIVEVLDPPSIFTRENLEAKCAVVINAPCKYGNCGSSYTLEEIAILYEYLLDGGNLLVMAEPFLRAPLSPLLSRMGIVMGDSIANHHDPLAYDVIESNLLLDNGDIGDDNFSDHPIFENISEIVLYGSDFILRNLVVNLIVSEQNATPSAVPLAALSESGNGKAVIVGDSDWLSAKDDNHNGIINLLERNNAGLAANILNWLCPPETSVTYARSIGYWRHQCMGNGHTDVSSDSLSHLQSRIEQESSFFTECFDLSGCSLLLAAPPNNDMLRKAAQQLYGLWLNYVSGKLLGLEVNSPRGEVMLAPRTDVRKIIRDIEAILCDPGSSLEQIEWAKDLAESINTSGEKIDVHPSVRVLKVRPQETATIGLTISNFSDFPYNLTLTASGDLDADLDNSQITVQANQTQEVSLFLRSTSLPQEDIGFAIVKMFNEEGELIDACVIGVEIEKTAGVVATKGNEISLSTKPNPAGGNIEMEIVSGNGAYAALTVYDARGRFIRSLVKRHIESGLTRLVWDRRDQDGAAVAPGIYFARLEIEGNSKIAKIVLSK